MPLKGQEDAMRARGWSALALPTLALAIGLAACGVEGSSGRDAVEEGFVEDSIDLPEIRQTATVEGVGEASGYSGFDLTITGAGDTTESIRLHGAIGHESGLQVSLSLQLDELSDPTGDTTLRTGDGCDSDRSLRLTQEGERSWADGTDLHLHLTRNAAGYVRLRGSAGETQFVDCTQDPDSPEHVVLASSAIAFETPLSVSCFTGDRDLLDAHGAPDGATTMQAPDWSSPFCAGIRPALEAAGWLQ